MSVETWDDPILGLNINTLRGIYSNGFEQPSPIQKQAILPIIQGRDVLAQAQSGTGKTGAFCIGSIERCSAEKKEAQCIILSPTRELALQTQNVFDKLAVQTGLTTYLLIGGTSVDRDIREMQRIKPQVLVGCPGRVLDFMTRQVFDCSTLRIIVMDEADEILSQGFVDQLYKIFQFLPENVQVAMFSATIPDTLESITKKIMRDPVSILVKTEQMTLEGIAQYYVMFETDNDKFLALKDLYESISVSQSIIYCNSVKRVVDLYDAMKQAKFPVCCIHSDMERDERSNAFQEFKSGKYRVLISSNVTARGLDVQQVSIVVNFDIPKDVHTYLHRIGRSGRWGRKGVGINFVTKYDKDKMRAIETHYQTQIQEMPMDFTAFLK
jgi:translation initiation factor 4A